MASGGISFALGALCCAALNDIVFKKAAAAGVSIGWFASTIGVTWAVVQVTGLYSFKSQLLFEWDEPTLKYGPWVALVLATANLLLIEALAGIPASAGSTVYRLNSIGVVLGGWLLLGEPLTSLKLGGVSAGVVAVLLMYIAGRKAPGWPRARDAWGPLDTRERGGAGGRCPAREIRTAPPAGAAPSPASAGHRLESLGLARVDVEEEEGDAAAEEPAPPPSPGPGPAHYYLLAVVASALRAGYGVLSKRALQEGANSTQLVLWGAGGWAVVGAAYALLRERSPWGWRSPTVVRYGMINGLLQMANIGLLNVALMHGSASIVVPVANCSFAMTLTISVLFGMEGVDRYKAAAIGMAVLCIGLLAKAAMQAGRKAQPRALAELDEPEAWLEGAWLLAPALLQLI